MEKLSKSQGEALVRLARSTLEGKNESMAGLSEKRGVFVTLHKHGRLRGCIGLPFPTLPLVDAVVKAARSASRDPRFPTLEKSELGDVCIEVTVLTPPEEVTGKRAEAPTKIVVGKHGVIVWLAGRTGLFLPQVAPEQGWDAEETLAQACMKAGLMPDAWLDKNARIYLFEGQIFAEQKPGGKIVEKKA